MYAHSGRERRYHVRGWWVGERRGGRGGRRGSAVLELRGRRHEALLQARRVALLQVAVVAAAGSSTDIQVAVYMLLRGATKEANDVWYSCLFRS